MRNFFGELLGTLILVFIGCSTVAVAVLFGLELWQVALLWGMAVFLGIVSSVRLSNAHLNPAVSFSFYLRKEIPFKQLLQNIAAQFIGAFLAGFCTYCVFLGPLIQYELMEGIYRGSLLSQQTAMIFGEFFPNPGNKPQIVVSPLLAFFVELIGTGLLMSSILLIGKTKAHSVVKFISISLTVSVLIFFGAKYTQIGINPARDFGPRLVAYFLGWGKAAFPTAPFSFFYVYILAPFLGVLLPSFIIKRS